MNPAAEIAQKAKKAFETSQLVSHEERVNALGKIHESLIRHKDSILSANRRDVEVHRDVLYLITSAPG